MCQRITCSSCGKPSYAGCGRHIETVLGDVPPDARCRCRESEQATERPPKAGSWLPAWLGGRAPKAGAP
jgi:hypothetical protein